MPTIESLVKRRYEVVTQLAKLPGAVLDEQEFGTHQNPDMDEVSRSSQLADVAFQVGLKSGSAAADLRSFTVDVQTLEFLNRVLTSIVERIEKLEVVKKVKGGK
jgi:hypothetical protein